MTSVRISNLPAANSLDGTELIPVVKDGATLKATISQFTTASLDNFIADGAGAVFRTVQSKLRDTVNIKDFGAAVDGVTDDAAAFQAAINTGKDVVLAPGTMVTGLVTMSNSSQRIVGTKACVIRRKNATAGNLFTITGSDCALIGFTIDGNSSNQTYIYNNREILVSGAFSVLKDLRIYNAASMGIGVVPGAIAPMISNNDIQGVGDFGIFVNNAGGGTDPAYGVCENNTVVEFGLQGAGGGASPSVGIGIRSAIGGWRVVNNLVRNITPRTNDQLGIECWTNSNNVIVDGNVVDMAAANSGEFGLSVTGYGSVVSNNLVLGTSSYGIEIVDRAVAVTGNVLRSPTGAGIAVNLSVGHSDPGDIISITGNAIENTASSNPSFAAIIVAGDPATTPIAIGINGNVIHGLSKGIQVDTQVNNYSISGNTIYNTGSTAASVVASGSHGAVTGNSILRSADVGTGNGGHILLDGFGILVGNNRIAGGGRMDNGVTITANAANSAVINNFITGATNAVFSSSTSDTVTVSNNVSTAGFALNAANFAMNNYNSSNKTSVSQKTMVSLGSFTVANLPTSSVPEGSIAYASNGRKAGEGAGAGTGVQVFRDATAWRACDTGATVAA